MCARMARACVTVAAVPIACLPTHIRRGRFRSSRMRPFALVLYRRYRAFALSVFACLANLALPFGLSLYRFCLARNFSGSRIDTDPEAFHQAPIG